MSTQTHDEIERNLVRQLGQCAMTLERAYALLQHTLNDSDRYYPDHTTFEAAVRIKVDIKNLLDGYPMA